MSTFYRLIFHINVLYINFYILYLFSLPRIFHASKPEIATFSPVLSDDSSVPFSFTSPVYETLLVDDGSLRQYLLHKQPHMGVPEPFSGNPSGDVVFTITGDSQAKKIFVPVTVKLGKFFFLQLYTSSNATVNRKKQSYKFQVEAEFTSKATFSISQIKLRNKTEVIVKSIERNENCPFFSMNMYHFNVFDNITTYESIGRVYASDADNGFNAQVYFYLDSNGEMPFRLDSQTGDIYPTLPLNNNYLMSNFPPFVHMRPEMDFKSLHSKYSFKVYAAHRGVRNHVHCSIVSTADVEINVIPKTHPALNVRIEITEDIVNPGKPGVVYARFFVGDASSHSTKIVLRILEPHMKEQFEIIPVINSKMWLLQTKHNIPSLSINSMIKFTLEALEVPVTNVNYLNQPELIIRRSQQSVAIPVVSRSMYKLLFPTEIRLTISEATIVNSTIAILQPNLIYSMTNSSFIYTDLRTADEKSHSLSKVKLTKTGAIIVTKHLDLEPTSTSTSNLDPRTIIIPFTVVDASNLLLSSAGESRVEILIQDVNDEDPIIKNNASVHWISENATVNTVVFRIDGNDPDWSHTPLSFTLYDAEHLPFMLIGPNCDTLVVSKPLDAETMPSEFLIRIRVSDSGLPLPRSVLSVFTVRIMDVNEHAPQFVEVSCESWLTVTDEGAVVPRLESALPSFNLGRYTAEDADRDGQGSVTIQLASHSLARPCFSIDERTGDLNVICSYLDSPGNRIILTLLASDGEKVSREPFTMHLNLVSVHNAAGGNFSKHCKSSHVYESLQMLKVQGKKYAVLLNQQPVYENLSNRHRPHFPTDLPTRLHLPENLPIGTEVLKFAASDEDGFGHFLAGRIIYGLQTLNVIPSENFEKNGHLYESDIDMKQAFLLQPNVHNHQDLLQNTVSLVVAGTLDRELVSSYNLLLHACDLGTPQLCTFSPINIFLEDLDDHLPEFVSFSQLESVEFAKQNDFILPSVINQISQNSFIGIFHILEDAKPDSLLGQVRAIDLDATSEVEYHLLNHQHIFKVDTTTGIISLQNSLDREKQAIHDLFITAIGYPRQNSQNPHFKTPYIDSFRISEMVDYTIRLSSTTCVQIVVDDVNDNAPEFISPGLPSNSPYAYDNSSSPSRTPPGAWFGSDTYYLFIPQDIPEGAYITTLRAKDADVGMNGLVKFSLFGKQESTTCFHAEQLSGVVRLMSGCDLLKSDLYEHKLTAWAMDHGTPQLSTNISFIIRIVPVRLNMFPPHFNIQPALYKGWIRENLPINSLVLAEYPSTNSLQISAVDPEGMDIIYTITGGSGFNAFRIDSQGFIFSTRVLDAESIPDEGGMWLTVYATELIYSSKYKPGVIAPEKMGPMHAIAEVFIEVIDENDHFPIPIIPYYECLLMENSPINTIITQISATDADNDANNLTYQITSGDPQGYFTIDSNNGIIKTTERALDRESFLKDRDTSELTLVVTISDGHLIPKTSEVSVTIQILDENDSIPKFMHTTSIEFQKLLNQSVPVYYFQQYETNSASSSQFCLGRVFAQDLDAGNNGTVNYHLFKSSMDQSFTVDTNSGWICTNEARVGEYQFQVYAKDQRTETATPLFVPQSIWVHVHILTRPTTTGAESTIQFNFAPPSVFSIAENAIIGQKLFNFALHDDSDVIGMRLTYRLLTSNRSYDHPFGLGLQTPTKLFVYLAQCLNYNHSADYKLWLIISNGLTELETNIQIVVEPVKLKRSIQSKFITFSTPTDIAVNVSQFPSEKTDHLVYKFAQAVRIDMNLSESFLVGNIIGVFQLIYQHNNRSSPQTDTDNLDTQVEYIIQLVGHIMTMDLFALNTRTGELRLNRALDYESNREHYLLIIARNMQNQASHYANVFIHILDINEYAPYFIGQYNASVITYPIIGKDVYTDKYVFYIVGNSPVGTLVGTIKAYDLDYLVSSNVNQLVYSIVGGDTMDYFEIHPTDGRLTLAKSLYPHYSDLVSANNFHLKSECDQFVPVHRLLIAVSDRATPLSRTNHTYVEVHIVPGPGGVDLPPPRFITHESIYLSINENSPIGTVLAPLIRFLQPEVGVHGFHSFQIISAKQLILPASDDLTSNSFISAPDSIRLFHVTPDSGLLITLAQLDREMHGDFYEIIIEVTGKWGVRSLLCDRINIRLRIVDENDNVPQIVSPLHYKAFIQENSPSGTIIQGYCIDPWRPECKSTELKPIKIEATDSDLHQNSQLYFSAILEKSNVNVTDLFVIDNSTGVIRLADVVKLDRESVTHWSLLIEVGDCGDPSLMSEQLVRVLIEVLDENDSPPSFVDAYYLQTTLFLPTYPTESVMQLRAVDPDLNDTIHYYLVGGDGVEQFTLGTLDGLLRVANNSSLVQTKNFDLLTSNDLTYFLYIEAHDNHKPNSHVTRTNVTIFVRLALYVRESISADGNMIIDPADGGLRIELPEHYSGSKFKLGQLSVRNAPVGAVYRFITLTPTPSISIDALTGAVFAVGDDTSSTELDRELYENVTIQVLVRDSQHRLANGSIHLHLLDINDNAPVFTHLPYYTTYCVGIDSVSTFPTMFDSTDQHSQNNCVHNHFRVTSIDKDFGVNGTVTYSLTNIRPRIEPPLVSVNATSGQIYLMRTLPIDWIGRQLEAVVAAIDGAGGSASLSATATVTIHLVAQNGPRFTASHYTASISESASIGEAVTLVEAVNQNKSVTNLIYRIVNVRMRKSFKQSNQNSLTYDFNESELLGLEHCPFKLEFKTGLVRVSALLDYETISGYLLLLEVIDTQTSLSARAHLTISVTDVNDNAPKFPVVEYTLFVSENVPIGESIFVFNTHDPDSDHGGQILYSIFPFADLDPLSLSISNLSTITSTNLAQLPFKCDSVTGELVVSQLLDFEQTSEYLFWVVASDQAPNPLISYVPVKINLLDYNDNPPKFDIDNTKSVPNLSTSLTSLSLSTKTCVQSITLNEQTPLGTMILHLTSIDPDLNDSLSYHLIYSSMYHQAISSNLFELDPITGLLKWMPQLDLFGRPIVQMNSNDTIDLNELQIQVQVTDGLYVADCQINIYLELFNWHKPQFEYPKFEQWLISEFNSLHSIVGRVKPANDLDRGRFGEIAYSICGGHGREWFQINAKTGIIRLNQVLDREQRNRFDLLICATDAGGLMDYLDLQILIQDMNDNRPQFTQLHYNLTLFPHQYKLKEVKFPHPLPLKLQATDSDIGNNALLVYRVFHPPNPTTMNVVSPADSNGVSQQNRTKATSLFSVDAKSGVLQLLRPITDADIMNNDMEYQLLIEACDSPDYADSATMCSSPAKVQIRFNKNSELQNLELPEIACTSRLLLENDKEIEREVAVCEMKPKNFTPVWRLTSITLLNHHNNALNSNLLQLIKSDHVFTINATTGQIFSTRPLDYETQPVYLLTVEARLKQFTPVVVLRDEVRILLINMNDCWPQFDAVHYSIELPENYPTNVRFLRTLAIDADDDNRQTDATDQTSIHNQELIRYSLWPTSILATENAAQSFTNNNELWKQQQQQDIDTQRRQRWENLHLYNPELIELNKQFGITSDGWVYLKRSLDFESKEKHFFEVVAVDAVGHWNSTHIEVDVRDINDNPPYWPLNESVPTIVHSDIRKRQVLSDEIEIPENWLPSNNSRLIYQLKITDLDTAIVSRPTFFLIPDTHLTDSHNVHFRIESNGAVWLRKALDREQTPVYLLRFQASDGLYITQDTFLLRILVKDVNDNSPVCWQPNRVLEVLEDIKHGATLLELNATDSDSDSANSLITYNMVVDSNQSLFQLDNRTGVLTLIGDLDYELQKQHFIQIKASDPMGLHCYFNVRLIVLDVNDNEPVFTPINIEPIPEDAPLGSLIGKIHAEDADSVDTNQLTYSLISPTQDASFNIESGTGLLRINRPLDRETKSIHQLTVIVTDSSTNSFVNYLNKNNSQLTKQHTVTATFSIQLLDINDSPPEFVNNSTRVEISELAQIGQKVSRLKAISADEGQNAVIQYRLLTKQPEFRLNETTGDLWLDKALDYEKTSAYFLTVEASDHGQPPLSTTTVLTVHVNDENDNRPKFVGRHKISTVIKLNELDESKRQFEPDFYQYFYTFNIVENSRNGTVVGKLNAIDADSGENGRVRFDILTDIDFNYIFSKFISNITQKSTEYIDVNNAKDRFNLDPVTGRLAILFSPDRELISDYWLAVKVQDYGKPVPLSTHTLVNVKVLDINDCAPIFERSNYEFYVEVDRSGNISGCSENQFFTTSPSSSSSSSNHISCVQTSSPTSSSSNRDSTLIGRLRITDADAYPNAGPFTCQLTQSGFVQSVHNTATRTSGAALFSVRSANSTQQQQRQQQQQSQDQNKQTNMSDYNTGECLIYAMNKLSVGSQSLVIRANDNGLTALHTTTTVTIRIVRMSNLPPEIVQLNATLIYYRDLYRPNIQLPIGAQQLQYQQSQLSPPPSSSSLTEPVDDFIITRIIVKDRTVHDRLYFELVGNNESRPNPFIIDPYDGTVRSAKLINPSSAHLLTKSPSTKTTKSEMKPNFDNVQNALMHLDSGVYPIRIRVTNGTLSSEATIHIKVLTITQEMLESATVIRITNLLPNLFYMENYHILLQKHLTKLLLLSNSKSTQFRGPITINNNNNNNMHKLSYLNKKINMGNSGAATTTTTAGDGDDDDDHESVFIISVQESDFVQAPHKSRHIGRTKRNLDRAVDILLAVYDNKHREFIRSDIIAQAVNSISDRLSQEFGGEIEVINDICTPQFCPRGRCQTKITIDPYGQMNRIEIHGVSQVTNKFHMIPVCQCPAHFTGLLCDNPLDACAMANCVSPKICIPHGMTEYSCVCPPPRDGQNCESIMLSNNHHYHNKDNCYSESCFHQREHGSLQFTGGTFIQWELVNPNPIYLELSFTVRTRQTIGPLATIRWSALQTFQFRLANNGCVVVSSISLSNGLPNTDWLISGQSITDGHWHRIRFLLTTTTARTVYSSNRFGSLDRLIDKSFLKYYTLDSGNAQSMKQLILNDLLENWRVELTVDGIHPISANIDWAAGDPYQQGILFGADLVQGFRPLSPVYNLHSVRTYPIDDNYNNNNNNNNNIHDMKNNYYQALNSSTSYTVPPIVMRSGIVGCFRDIKINRIKPPYQINLVPERATLVDGLNPTTTSIYTVRTRKLEFGCQAKATVSSSCASGPCQHGGNCVVNTKHTASSTSTYNCECPPLFHGHHCERTSDACLLAPCHNGGSCQTLMGPSLSKTPSNSGLAAYRCICPAGLSGLHCELLYPELITVDKSVQTSALLNELDLNVAPGVNCHSAQLVLQQNLLQSKMHSTSKPITAQSTPSKVSSSRFSYSSSSSASVSTESGPLNQQTVCLHNSACIDIPSGPYCLCKPGWYGARCEYDVDECELVKQIYHQLPNLNHKSNNEHIQWLETRASPTGDLCSPYGPGRGVCLNKLGSYKCNCSVGFTGSHCQSKNLIPLVPDSSPLGLSQFHIYIIVGLLAFLFLAALATIVLLACRARGLIGGAFDDSRRSVKSLGAYWPNGNQQGKLSNRSSETRLGRYTHSAGGSLSGMPFVASSPGQVGHLGTHPRCRVMSGSGHHHRPSLSSSAFGYPIAMDESGTALLANNNSGQMPFLTDCVKRGSQQGSVSGTVADFPDHDDSSVTANSRLVLLPTANGEHVPVMMMLSPLPSGQGISNRASMVARYSPASSVVLYGPSVPSGCATPTNQMVQQSVQPGIGMETPSSACIAQRQYSTGSQVALYPAGHPAYLPHPQSHHQFIQMVNMRPNSVVGSDRLSLGSGSDRFSAHGSQVLVQPNSTCAIPYVCCPQSQNVMTPQLQYHHPHHQHQTAQPTPIVVPRHQPWTPQLPINNIDAHVRSNLLTVNTANENTNIDGMCMTMRPQTNTENQSELNAEPDIEHSTNQNSQDSTDLKGGKHLYKPRPLPVSMQHTTSYQKTKQNSQNNEVKSDTQPHQVSYSELNGSELSDQHSWLNLSHVSEEESTLKPIKSKQIEKSHHQPECVTTATTTLVGIVNGTESAVHHPLADASSNDLVQMNGNTVFEFDNGISDTNDNESTNTIKPIHIKSTPVVLAQSGEDIPDMDAVADDDNDNQMRME